MLDKKITTDLSMDATKALQAVAEKYGLVVKSRGGKWNSDNATLRFEFATVGQTGVVVTTSVRELELYGRRFGLLPTDLGRKFIVRGQTYEVTGLTKRSYKYPVCATQLSTGKPFKFRPQTVKDNWVSK